MRSLDLRLPEARQPVNADTCHFAINRKKLRAVWRREGRHLLRAFDVTGGQTGKLWEFYLQLTQIERAFQKPQRRPIRLRSGQALAIRPIHHQREDRIEAHIFVAFPACCLQVTLQRRRRGLAPGLWHPD